jgi:hypothetical protein
MLLMQGVQFAQACLADIHHPVMAFKGGHCGTPGQGHANPNACLTQCLQSDQSNSNHQLEIPSAPLVGVLVLPAITTVCPPAPSGHSVVGAVETGPPPSIRFCSFLL